MVSSMGISIGDGSLISWRSYLDSFRFRRPRHICLLHRALFTPLLRCIDIHLALHVGEDLAARVGVVVWRRNVDSDAVIRR